MPESPSLRHLTARGLGRDSYGIAAYKVAGANRRWRLQFRCRGSRRESAVAQLSALGDSARIMKRAIQILLSLFCVLRQLIALGAERDILEIAKERPLNVTVNGVPAQYGDPNLAAAVGALVDIPHPWTVPKMIAVFDKESAVWLRKLQAQIDKKSDQMWEGWERESERCGHLATLLASSRDPRAALVLGGALDNRPEFPGGIRVIEGLYRYFLPDRRYRQLPPEKTEIRVYTNVYIEMSRQVKQWWTINKEELKASAKAQSK